MTNQIDPTRLALLRSAWEREREERQKRIRDAVILLILTLSKNRTPANYNATMSRIQSWFGTLASGTALQAWGALIPWYETYTLAAYKGGVIRAYTDAKPPPDKEKKAAWDGAKAGFLLLLVGAATRTDALVLTYDRIRRSLEALGTTASSQVSAILTRGIQENRPGTEMVAAVRSVLRMSETRASLIVQTEVTRAHAEGQLDALEALGIGQVTADVELQFTTKGNKKVCKVCKKLNGRVYTIKQARGVIPVHPRCCCSWRIVPARRAA